MELTKGGAPPPLHSASGGADGEHVPVLVHGTKGGAPPPLHSASGGADGEHVPALVRGEAYAGDLSVFSRQVNTGLASLTSSERRISATIPSSTMPPTAPPMATPAISPSESPEPEDSTGNDGDGGGDGGGGMVQVGGSSSALRTEECAQVCGAQVTLGRLVIRVG